MNSLGNLEHHNEISFYVDDKLYLKGEILIDDKCYCEGIITDNNNKYFVFGTYVKYDYLDLYIVINDSKIYRWIATKGYLKYNGKYSKLNSDVVHDFYLKARGLDADPRDYGSDNPMYVFLKELKLFREEWFQDEKNSKIYNSLNSISSKIDKLHK